MVVRYVWCVVLCIVEVFYVLWKGLWKSWIVRKMFEVEMYELWRLIV